MIEQSITEIDQEDHRLFSGDFVTYRNGEFKKAKRIADPIVGQVKMVVNKDKFEVALYDSFVSLFMMQN